MNGFKDISTRTLTVDAIRDTRRASILRDAFCRKFNGVNANVSPVHCSAERVDEAKLTDALFAGFEASATGYGDCCICAHPIVTTRAKFFGMSDVDDEDEEADTSLMPVVALPCNHVLHQHCFQRHGTAMMQQQIRHYFFGDAYPARCECPLCKKQICVVHAAPVSTALLRNLDALSKKAHREKSGAKEEDASDGDEPMFVPASTLVYHFGQKRPREGEDEGEEDDDDDEGNNENIVNSVFRISGSGGLPRRVTSSNTSEQSAPPRRLPLRPRTGGGTGIHPFTRGRRYHVSHLNFF